MEDDGEAADQEMAGRPPPEGTGRGRSGPRAPARVKPGHLLDHPSLGLLVGREAVDALRDEGAPPQVETIESGLEMEGDVVLFARCLHRRDAYRNFP